MKLFKSDSARRFIKTASRNANRYSPEISLAAGIACSIVAFFMVADAAPKAKEAIEEKHSEEATSEEPISKPKQIATDICTVAPIYGPAVCLEAFAVFFVMRSYKITTRRLVAATTSYTLLDNQFREYQRKVIEKLGEKKEEKLRHSINEDDIHDNPPTELNTLNSVCGTDKYLCRHGYTGLYFYSNKEDILRAVDKVNAYVDSGDYMSFNDFLNDLDYVANVPIGNEIGWKGGNRLDLKPFDWVNVEGSDRPILVFSFYKEPEPGFRNLY